MVLMNELLAHAEAAARTAESWADLSNFLFNPVDGLIAQACPTREAREALLKTETYAKVRQLLSDAMDKHGLVEGGTPTWIDEFVVRVSLASGGAGERDCSSGYSARR